MSDRDLSGLPVDALAQVFRVRGWQTRYGEGAAVMAEQVLDFLLSEGQLVRASDQRLALSRVEGEVRGLHHHDRKATAELDAAGVKKWDDIEESSDSTDDRCGRFERSLWVRIRDLRARAEKAGAEVERLRAGREVTDERELVYAVLWRNGLGDLTRERCEVEADRVAAALRAALNSEEGA